MILLFGLLSLFQTDPAAVSSPLPEFPETVRAAYADAPLLEIQTAWQGNQMLLERRYDEVQKLLEEYEQQAPQSLLPTMGLMFMYQVRMLENFDFRWLPEFEAAERRNRILIDESFDKDRADRWHRIMAGASVGLRGMIQARRHNWMKAAAYGLEGLKLLDEVNDRGQTPFYYDVYYGKGLYHYSVSWAQQRSLILAVFPDRREQGLNELALCADRAPLTGPLATYALGYLYVMEGRIDVALQRIIPLARKHPKNIIFRTLLGRLYLANNQADKAYQELNPILEAEPNLTYVGYHVALALGRMNREPERAAKLLENFVAEKDVLRPKPMLAQSNLFLAEYFYRKGNHEKCSEYLKMIESRQLNKSERQRYQQLKRVFS